MLKIRELMFAVALAGIAAAATAGMTEQLRASRAAGAYPECRNGVSAEAAKPDASASESGAKALIANPREDVEGVFDEYLSFHAQVTEGSGKFLLMPWPPLRTHAD
jgi:hypothetical protein